MFKKDFFIDNKPYTTTKYSLKQIIKGVMHFLVPYHSFLQCNALFIWSLKCICMLPWLIYLIRWKMKAFLDVLVSFRSVKYNFQCAYLYLRNGTEKSS